MLLAQMMLAKEQYAAVVDLSSPRSTSCARRRGRRAAALLETTQASALLD
jgi:hypothetical protein